jgi:hypothetical protein
MKKLIVLVVLWASMGFFATAATANKGPATQNHQPYAQLLNTELAQCKAKTRYLDSKLETMRQIGTRAALKAQFLDTHRETLLTEMRTGGLCATTAKAERFLNQRFTAHLSKLRAEYRRYLDTEIAQCKAKLRHGQSKFDTLQRKAAVSALKAQFLETHHDALVAKMMATQLGTQTARLDHFINAHFNQYVHPTLLAYLTGR